MRAILSSALSGLFQGVLILHRYLGVVLGVIMTLWCLSGFVMMYQGFPETTEAERRAALAPLDPAVCCDLSALPADARLDGFRVEMLAGKPVLRAGGELVDLATGKPWGEIAEADIRRVADDFARGNGMSGGIAKAERIRVDQWSVGVYRREPVLWKVSFDGASQTWLYVSGRTGLVVQDASVRERMLSWFGAVPHWLYPTLLRQDGPLWTQIVIWLSVAGVFLTITGLTVGIVRLRSKSGAWWPYKRPMWLWHHLFGVFAGVLVLSWVFSGLMTMQPWGLFETEPVVSREQVMGRINAAEARALIQAGPKVGGDSIVQLRAAPLLGEARALAVKRDGSSVRYSAEGPAPLVYDAVVKRFAGAPGVLAGAQVELMAREDSYYYGHKETVALPVIRATLSDVDRTRIYISPETGDVLRVADGTSQRYRWLDSGLHSLDLPVLRTRPMWDGVVLVLLAAVTISCATGAWLSFTRMGRDFGRLAAWLRREGRKAS